MDGDFSASSCYCTQKCTRLNSVRNDLIIRAMKFLNAFDFEMIRANPSNFSPHLIE